MTMFESWSNAKLYVVDVEKYTNMHWRDITSDLEVRRQLCMEAGEVMITKVGFETFSKRYPEAFPYSFTFLQYSDAMVCFNENNSQWIIVKNRYSNPPQWEGSDGELALAMNNWMMERVLC